MRPGLSTEAPGGESPWQPLAHAMVPAIPAATAKPSALATNVDVVDVDVDVGASALGCLEGVRSCGTRVFIAARGRSFSCRGGSTEELPIAEGGALSVMWLDGLGGLSSWSFMCRSTSLQRIPVGARREGRWKDRATQPRAECPSPRRCYRIQRGRWDSAPWPQRRDEETIFAARSFRCAARAGRDDFHRASAAHAARPDEDF